MGKSALQFRVQKNYGRMWVNVRNGGFSQFRTPPKQENIVKNEIYSIGLYCAISADLYDFEEYYKIAKERMKNE